LTFANPVATLYDELKDPSLRNEVEALKQRVSTLEANLDKLLLACNTKHSISKQFI
jgi:OOP family OmpA-OmpF porin